MAHVAKKKYREFAASMFIGETVSLHNKFTKTIENKICDLYHQNGIMQKYMLDICEGVL